MKYNKILENKKFINALEKNEEYEKNREFCRHNFSHLIDVARIGFILSLEENAKIEKEIIYAAALLHDIGRYIEYADGTPHEKASADIAAEILTECGYPEKEINLIVSSILSHRDNPDSSTNTLGKILYKADKLSRNCFMCSAKDKCCWSEDKKNKSILY